MMGREPGDERGGDQATWLDLVARLEHPTADEHAMTPWPDSENLGHVPQGLADSANARKSADPAQGGTGQPSDGAGLTPGTGLDPGASVSPGADGSDSGQGKRAPVSRGRVIRPASFMRFADSPGGAAEPSSQDADGWDVSGPEHDRSSAGGEQHDRSSAGEEQSGLGSNPGELEPDQAEDTGFADPEPWRASARNLSAEDYLNLADLGYIDYDTGDNNDRYIPPPLPPQPKLDPIARGAWTALLGGPGYLFLAMLLGWQVPGWAQLIAVLAFIAGFLVLVIRLGDGPSRRDGPDQGAVV